MTDSIKMIAENTAKYAGGSWPQKRYAESIENKPQDTRTGDEIFEEFLKNTGLVVIPSEPI